MNLKHLIYIAATIAVGMAAYAASPNNVIDEVAWMIGDEPIYKSEIEQAYADMQSERTPIQGDPYCVIPEQLAIERLSCTRPTSTPWKFRSRWCRCRPMRR